MSVAKVTEITAESTKSFDDAIREGISRAAKTLHNIESVSVQEQQVVIKDNKPQAYRVGMKVSFILKD
jgi:flavin-binding protein dodecin